MFDSEWDDAVEAAAVEIAVSKALHKIKAVESADNKYQHVKCDDAILELLRDLGYDDVADAYESAMKFFCYA